MDTLISSVDSSDLLFVFALFFTAISGIKLTPNLRVTMVYTLAFLFYYLKSISVLTSTLGALFVLFLILEIFSSDEGRRRMFGIVRKLVDFLFQLLFQYYVYAFIASIASLWILRYFQAPEVVSSIIGFALIGITVSLTSRSKFATFPLGEISDRLTRQVHINDATIGEGVKEKIEILLAMEDKDFFERKAKQHTIPASTVVAAIRRRNFRRFAKHPIRKLKEYASRGYGTIEMQLIRTVGLELGSYDYKIRRKAFEFIYANMFFNAYAELFAEDSVARRNIRAWIIRNYIESVSVKFGERILNPTAEDNTIKQLYGRSVAEISNEEFFIWCLGLRYFDKGVGPSAISIYEGLILRFGLDRELLIDIASKC